MRNPAPCRARSRRACALMAGAFSSAIASRRRASLSMASTSPTSAATGGGGARRALDADGLMVLPGIIDIHGDAFERQMMPRPGVHFPLDVALLDTDRQVIANGITTVFHGVTWSWEPGLRGPENARALVAAIEALRPQLAADTRFHLRHETYNLDAEAEVMEWIDAGRIGMLAFNNHVPDLDSSRPSKITQMAERCGLSLDRFTALGG